MSITRALEKLKQEDYKFETELCSKFEAILNYIGSLRPVGALRILSQKINNRHKIKMINIIKTCFNSVI